MRQLITLLVTTATGLGLIAGFIFWLASINDAAHGATQSVRIIEHAVTTELIEIKEILWDQNERLSRIEGKLE